MPFLEALLLGLTQGLTEFIPVSSSGHLEIARAIFQINFAANFHIFLELINIGTLLALLIFYRRKIWQIILNIFQKHDFRLFLNLIITTIPAVIIGFTLGNLIEENPFFKSLAVIASAMAIVGVLMILLDRWTRFPHLQDLKDEAQLKPRHALAIGLAQCFAFIPGVSRSGATIIAGRIMGLNSASAADYSFLASIPIMFGVTLLSLVKHASFVAQNLPFLAFANLVAFLSGLLALFVLLRILHKPKTLQFFGWYRLILALAVFVFLFCH